MTRVSRREFFGGALAFGGFAALRASGGADETPLLRFGVTSDIHIGGKVESPLFIENALRWLSAQGVDAVLCPGDIAHSGLISELEGFAAVWNKVFPGGRGADGRKVELMISTGNHDIDAWGGRWNGFTEDQMRRERLNYGDNLPRTWERLFGEPWELIWRREVKGFTFIGSQWSSLKPPIEEYFRKHAAELEGGKPFFYCQHEHPKGTCHGSYSDGDDRGESVRALSPFPNAVAISGHSHCAISDERTVWQGAFTSIGAGCTREASLAIDKEYINASAYWHWSHKKKFMAPLSWMDGGRDIGGCYEMIEVFSDHLAVHRRSVTYDEPIGPTWIVPLPAAKGGPFDFARRRRMFGPPQFPAGAAVRTEFCPSGHPLEGVGHRGEPCYAVTFPCANRGGRVFEYWVAAKAEGMKPVVRKIIAPGFDRPPSRADLPGTCLIAASDLPSGRNITFTVTPCDCFMQAGRPLAGEWR